jgi:hypothetical protein
MPGTKTQVKFKIDTGILSAFKARCASEGVSMTSVVQGWMESRRTSKDLKAKTLTLPQRKKTVAEVIALLDDVLSNQEQYRDLIPEQFEQRREDADHFCNNLSEAIEYLEDAF